MNSQEYFRNRVLEREQKWYDLTTDAINSEIKSYYESSLKKILDEIAILYARYADENGLTMQQARRLIRGKEFRQWRKSLIEYVEESKSDKKILKELNTLAMRSRISRLEMLHSKTLMEIAELSEKLEKFEDAHQARAYKEFYYGNLYDVHRTVGLNVPPVLVDSAQIEKVIRTPWSGANYSAIIWKNGDDLARQVKSAVVQAIHRGTSARKFVKGLSGNVSKDFLEAATDDVKKRVKIAERCAERLIRTELNFVQNKAALDAIEAAGLESYQYMAALDARTCPRCGGLDGKIIPLEEKMQGENAPPMHPRCRCTITAVLGDYGKRSAKVKGRREKVPLSMSYAEWKELYIDKTKTLDEWRKARAAESFTPAKNITEANEFAMKVLGIAQASYKGCHIDVANEWNLGLFESFMKFPELKKNFRFVGECHERNSAYKAQLLDWCLKDLLTRYPQYSRELLEKRAKNFVSREINKMSISKYTVAQSWSPKGEVAKNFGGVTVNRDFAKDLQYFLSVTAQGVKNKYHPAGCTTIRSHLDHEIGHQLDKLLGLRDMPEVQKLFDERVVATTDYTKITDGLSRYAWQNGNENKYAEFIAEAWAEYCNNPNPREIAQKIGEIIEREYKEKFS